MHMSKFDVMTMHVQAMSIRRNKLDINKCKYVLDKNGLAFLHIRFSISTHTVPKENDTIKVRRLEGSCFTQRYFH
jgi:hypothetical protein